MPRGNATVVLRPRVDERAELELSSAGGGFGDAGLYRVQQGRDGLCARGAWRR